jgi:hypothetical protein
MPSSLDTGLTFGEILLEMAVRYGTQAFDANGVAILPGSNTEEYRQLVKAANRGYSRFLHRREWTFLTRTLQLTTYAAGNGPWNIDGNAARYRLPHWCREGPAGNGELHYSDTLSPYAKIMTADIEEVTALHNSSSGSGPPTHYGIGPLESESGLGFPETDCELILWPTPGASYTLRAQVYLAEHKLVAPSQRHIAGAVHDETITCECIWALYESDVLAPERDGTLAALTASLADSERIDNRKTLGLKGKLRDTTIDGATQNIVTLPETRVNGIPMTLTN